MHLILNNVRSVQDVLEPLISCNTITSVYIMIDLQPMIASPESCNVVCVCRAQLVALEEESTEVGGTFICNGIESYREDHTHADPAEAPAHHGHAQIRLPQARDAATGVGGFFRAARSK